MPLATGADFHPESIKYHLQRLPECDSPQKTQASHEVKTTTPHHSICISHSKKRSSISHLTALAPTGAPLDGLGLLQTADNLQGCAESHAVEN